MVEVVTQRKSKFRRTALIIISSSNEALKVPILDHRGDLNLKKVKSILIVILNRLILKNSVLLSFIFDESSKL